MPRAIGRWRGFRRGKRAGTEILRRAETMPMMAPRQVLIVEEAESVEKLGEKVAR